MTTDATRQAPPQPNGKLRRAREHKNLTQEKLAEAIGCSNRQVKRWESGESRPTSYLRGRLCDFFGRSAEELGLIEEETLGIPPGVIAGNDLPHEDPISSLKRARARRRVHVWLFVGVPGLFVLVLVFTLLMMRLASSAGLQLKSSYRGTAICTLGCSTNDPSKIAPFEIVLSTQDQHGHITALWIYTSPHHTTYSCTGTVAPDKHITLTCTGKVNGQDYRVTIQGSIYSDGHLEGTYYATSATNSNVVERNWTAS